MACLCEIIERIIYPTNFEISDHASYHMKSILFVYYRTIFVETVLQFREYILISANLFQLCQA